MRSDRISDSIARGARRSSAAAFMFFTLALLACAQSAQKGSASQQSQPNPNANAPGHHEIKLADLPPPEVQKGPVNFSKIIPRPEGAELTLPQGFEINV